MSSTLADALAGGSQFVRWDDLGVGGVVTGTIDTVDMRQARKFQSNDLDFWDDGKPKMQAIITVQTGSKLDDDDNGLRAISINLWSGQRKALGEACKNAGVDSPKPGQTFTARWVSGVGKTGDPRIFAYVISGEASSGLADALGTPAATPPADTAAAQAALSNLSPEQRKALGIN